MTSKALVVDDSRLARLALSKLLVKRNYEVDVAGSGQEALEYLKANRPAVVFMDFMMPDMDGYEVALMIYQNSSTTDIPVVMCTSQDTPEDRQRAERNGAKGFLTKPTSDESLDAVLAEIFPRAQVSKEAVAPAAAVAAPGLSREEIQSLVERLVSNAIANSAREAVQVAVEDAVTTAQASMENNFRGVAQQVAKQTAEAVVAGLPKDNHSEAAVGVARTMVDQAMRKMESDTEQALKGWAETMARELETRFQQWVASDDLGRSVTQSARNEAKTVSSQAADALLKRVAQQAAEKAEEVAQTTAQRIAESAAERAATATAASISRESTRQVIDEAQARWAAGQVKMYIIAAATVLTSVAASAAFHWLL
jgi:CheY-like chemotaxis protein